MNRALRRTLVVAAAAFTLSGPSHAGIFDPFTTFFTQVANVVAGAIGSAANAASSIVSAVGTGVSQFIGSVVGTPTPPGGGGTMNGNPNMGTGNAPLAYAETRNPIVLVHGFAGTESYLKVYDYWFGFKDVLDKNGAKYYVANLSGFNSEEGSNGRGQQLIDFLESIKMKTGARRFNLVGHSQGGLTSRYVAALRPDLVASITTIATPHRGTAFAEIVNETLSIDPFGVLKGVAAAAVDIFGFATNKNSLLVPQNAMAAFNTLTKSGIDNFNINYASAGLKSTNDCSGGDKTETRPRGRDTFTHRLYSYTGTAFRRTPGGTSGTDVSVLPLDAALIDVSTGLMAMTGNAMFARGSQFKDDDGNDGLVSKCSSMFGDVISTAYRWNHLDEVNQMAGIRGGYAEDPRTVLVEHANRLQKDGL